MIAIGADEVAEVIGVVTVVSTGGAGRIPVAVEQSVVIRPHAPPGIAGRADELGFHVAIVLAKHSTRPRDIVTHLDYCA